MSGKNMPLAAALPKPSGFIRKSLRPRNPTTIPAKAVGIEGSLALAKCILFLDLVGVNLGAEALDSPGPLFR